MVSVCLQSVGVVPALQPVFRPSQLKSTCCSVMAGQSGWSRTTCTGMGTLTPAGVLALRAVKVTVKSPAAGKVKIGEELVELVSFGPFQRYEEMVQPSW